MNSICGVGFLFRISGRVIFRCFYCITLVFCFVCRISIKSNLLFIPNFDSKCFFREKDSGRFDAKCQKREDQTRGVQNRYWVLIQYWVLGIDLVLNLRGIDSGIGLLPNTWLNTYDFIFSGIGIESGIGSEAYTWLNTRYKSQYLYYMKYWSSS